MIVILLILPSFFTFIDFLHLCITKERCPLWRQLDIIFIIASFIFAIAISFFTDLGIGLVYGITCCMVPCIFLGATSEKQREIKNKKRRI